MKKLFLGVVCLIGVASYSQEKWRELTLGTTNGISLSGRTFTQLSANLSYELGKKFSISSWNGFNYNYTTKQSWIASQTTLDKRLGKFVVGGGMQYGTNTVGQFVQTVGFNDNFYFVAKCQYKIKL